MAAFVVMLSSLLSENGASLLVSKRMISPLPRVCSDPGTKRSSVADTAKGGGKPRF